MIVQLSWATRLEQAILRQYTYWGGGSVELLKLECVEGDEISLHFSATWFEGVRGVRLRSDDYLDPDFYSSSTFHSDNKDEEYFDDLGFDIVVLMLCEPAPDDWFTAPDNEGIRWRILDIENDFGAYVPEIGSPLFRFFHVLKQRLFHGKFGWVKKLNGEES
jgi:hypothetical protein